MLRSLALLLPAVVPSWRFFDYIAPSPRVQFQLFDNNQQALTDWQEYRPRPARVEFPQMLGRMLWNPFWNESLFVVSCSERLIEYPTSHSETEIGKRIIRDLKNVGTDDIQGMKFRLLQVKREGESVVSSVVYESRLFQPSSGENE